MTEPFSPPLPDDFVMPFLVHQTSVRGRLVRLSHSVDTILKRHDYPAPVAHLLAECLSVVAILSANLKADGVFTLQLRGDGAVPLLVADAEYGGQLRGYAQVPDAAHPDILAAMEPGKHPSLSALIGKGYLAITLDQGEGEDSRYQGIVDITGHTLADAIHHYFSASEQMLSAIKIAVGRQTLAGSSEAGWRAAGMMIERLPEEGGLSLVKSDVEEERARAAEEKAASLQQAAARAEWEHVHMLMRTVEGLELLDPKLDAHTLLYRLFHEDGVRVYDQRPVMVVCRCSRARIEQVLGSLSRTELREMEVEGKLSVNCQFCNKTEWFDREQIEHLFN